MYHLNDDECQAEIEISPFVKQHSFVLDPELEERIKQEGTQLIDLTPVDTALEAIDRRPPAGAPIIQSWSGDKTDQEPEPENSTNLIEIMPIPPHRTPDN